MSDASKQVIESIQNAVSQGQLNATVANNVLEALDDVAVAGCQGVNIDEIDSEDITLVTAMVDKSGSMSQFRDAVIQAYNDRFLKPLRGAKNARSILLSTWVFSDEGSGPKVRLLHGYTPVPDCQNLTDKEYTPDLYAQTPLNEAAWEGMVSQVGYGQTLRDNGTRTKNIIVIFSDGEENASSRLFPAKKVREFAEDLLRQETYILSYVYFSMEKDDKIREADGERTAKKLGFPPQHMLTSSQDDSAIRRTFGTVSSSIISASQTNVSASSLSANAFFVNGR